MNEKGCFFPQNNLFQEQKEFKTGALLVYLTTAGALGVENMKLRKGKICSLKIKLQAFKWMFKIKKTFIKQRLTH